MVALVFISAFAQTPPKGAQTLPQKKSTPATNTTPVPAKLPQKPKADGRTIIDIKSKRMFPIEIGDSTGYAFVGNVIAYHNGAVMLCDSAVRYNENKIECFNNVLINKENTYVYGDRVFYDRLTNTAEVFSPLIKMIDGDATLYTYYFKYNTLENVGEYYGGGTMMQNQMLLESDRGYYFSNTRDAVSVGNVELRDSTYLICSDSLGFNMDTEIATFYKKTYIWNEKKEILSANNGWYDTKSDHYHFMSNAYVLSADQEVWADDIDYRSDNEDATLRRDIQIFDREQEVLAFGDYGQYWGEKGDAMLTENPSVIYFHEQEDSVYMRADSIFLYVIDSTSIYSADYIGRRGADSTQVDTGEELIVDPSKKGSKTPKGMVAGNTASATEAALGEGADTTTQTGNGLTSPVKEGLQATETDTTAGGVPPPESKASGMTGEEGSVSEPMDGVGSLGSPDSGSALTPKPPAPAKMSRKELRELRKLEKQERNKAKSTAASVADPAEVTDRLSVANSQENAVTEDTTATAENDELTTDETSLVGGVQPADSLAVAGASDASESTLAETDKNSGEEQKERVVVAYSKVKIFRPDVQAICDSLVSFSRDSTVHLHKSPVLWNGENQIKSDLTVAYVKNQAIDRAVFTGGEEFGNPVMSVELDKDHYNQITGKMIEAFFKDNEIYRTDVKGNGQAYYYMQDEENGAFQSFMSIECSDITFLIIDQEIDQITFRGTPVYSIYPMNMIPASQPTTLPNFVWEGDKKPTKEEIFNRKIRLSQRTEYEKIPQPLFPLTQSINEYRLRLLQDGLWRDRDDDITFDAKEYKQRIESQQGRFNSTTK